MFAKGTVTADGVTNTGAAIGLYYPAYYAFMKAAKESFSDIASDFSLDLTYYTLTATEDPHSTYTYDPATGALVEISSLASSTTTTTEETVDSSQSSFSLEGSDITELTNVSGGIRLTWEASDTAQRFEIYRYDKKGKKGSKIADISDGLVTSYTDKTASAGIEYRYRVYSYATPPSSSEEISVYGSMSDGIIRLKAPKLKSVRKSGAKKLTVKWKKAAAGSGYEIEYSLKKNFSKSATIRVNGLKTLKKVISGLKSKKYYYVRVRAYKKNSSGLMSYSTWSGTKKVKTK